MFFLGRDEDHVRCAKNLEYLCEQEMQDIETCSECFIRSNTNKDWFEQVCNPPHLLVWARMTGYPYWPAKVISFGVATNKKIDVRFFGKHTRTNVFPEDCILFADDPNKNHNKDLSSNECDALTDSMKVCMF